MLVQDAEVLADAAVLRPEQVAAGRWQQCHATCSVVGGRAEVLLPPSSVLDTCLGAVRGACAAIAATAGLGSSNVASGTQQWNSDVGTQQCVQCVCRSVHVRALCGKGVAQALLPCSIWHLQPWSKGGYKWGCLAAGRACVLTAIAMVFDQFLWGGL